MRCYETKETFIAFSTPQHYIAVAVYHSSTRVFFLFLLRLHSLGRSSHIAELVAKPHEVSSLGGTSRKKTTGSERVKGRKSGECSKRVAGLWVIEWRENGGCGMDRWRRDRRRVNGGIVQNGHREWHSRSHTVDLKANSRYHWSLVIRGTSIRSLYLHVHEPESEASTLLGVGTATDFVEMETRMETAGRETRLQ